MTTTKNFIKNIYLNKEKSFNPDFHNHLGASLIGHHCPRYIWLEINERIPFTPEGRLLRLFETGHQQEYRIALELKELGLDVWIEVDNPYLRDYLISKGINCNLYDEPNPDLHFQVGRFKGSLDILTKGWQDYPDEVLNTEIKTFSDNRFKDFVKNGIFKSDYQYYCQAQTYMGFKHLSHTILIGVNKNTDEIYSQVIDFDKELFDRLVKFASEIINGDIPPVKYESENYLNWRGEGCKYCKYKCKCWRTNNEN